MDLQESYLLIAFIGNYCGHTTMGLYYDEYKIKIMKPIFILPKVRSRLLENTRTLGVE